jgi:hypothetical protein
MLLLNTLKNRLFDQNLLAIELSQHLFGDILCIILDDLEIGLLSEMPRKPF